jgi:glycosyltransferase involved in cell wall biosynthesis
MAVSLSQQNHNVEIVSSKVDLINISDGISLNCFAGDKLSKRNKIFNFNEKLKAHKPDVIICSEPLTILAAKKYNQKQSRKARIVYDVTEWYPSQKNLAPHNVYIRWFVFIKLLLFNFWASSFTDSFIFGEFYKSRVYRILYPLKSFIFTTYYPNLKFLNYIKPELKESKLRLSYSGKICLDKGYKDFLNMLKILSDSKKELQIEVKIIGWYENPHDKKEYEELFQSISKNISLTIYGRQNFKGFLDLIKDTDVFIDLRSDNFENQHCLPIKIFYYCAFGRPVIFSDLKAIRKEVKSDKFGFLVQPSDYERIVKILFNYIEDKELYYKHCEDARHLAETNYNWQKIESQFLKFITSSLDAH